MSRVRVVTEPTIEPISLNAAYDHLRATTGSEDQLVGSLVRSARVTAEHITGRSIMSKTLELRLDAWPDADYIDLPRAAPLQSVTHIKYTDADEVETTVATSVYRVDTYAEPGRVWLKSDQSWPDVVLARGSAIEIEYVAGYANRGAVPDDMISAMLLIAGDLYENRETTVVRPGVVAVALPAAMTILNRNRVRT